MDVMFGNGPILSASRIGAHPRNGGAWVSVMSHYITKLVCVGEWVTYVNPVKNAC